MGLQMNLSRRAFLKLGGSSLAALAMPRRLGLPPVPPEWPADTPLARVAVARLRLSSRPHPEAKRLAVKYFDEVLVVDRSVVGTGFYPHNHLWFETSEGYLYSSWAQPVRSARQEAPAEVPAEGIYVEASVPYTDARTRPDPAAPVAYRLYYGSTYNVKQRVADSGDAAWYRLNDENGVRMYGKAIHFRPIAPEEFAPLSPQVDGKLIRVSLGRQSLSAFEGQAEVFRTRISSGRTYFGSDGKSVGGRTPAGSHPIWSKRASRHMSGGTLEEGYDLPGVPWVTYFAGNGAAIHGTYWHNDFGTPKSAGCLNVRPEDAKWLFRWTTPEVPYVPGTITVQMPGGTRVVIEA